VLIRLVRKISDLFLEQQISIKFCVKLGRNASDTCGMLSGACGEEAMKMSSVFDWYERFREGRENVKDDEDNAHHFLRYLGYCSL
jgi:hypothetical protein